MGSRSIFGDRHRIDRYCRAVDSLSSLADTIAAAGENKLDRRVRALNWFVAIVFVILPLVGLGFALRTLRLIRHGVRVAGTSINHKAVVRTDAHSRESRIVHYPIVQFLAPKGNTHTVTMSVSTGPREIGAVVKVIYPPERPEAAQIASFASLWFFPLFFCAPAVTFGFFIGAHVALSRFVE